MTEGGGGFSGAIRFLWWNTSLSPPGAKSRTTPEDIAFVVEQLSEARELFGWDVLGLCEVNSEDVAAILVGLDDSMLSSVQMGQRSSKAVNDTALLFDRGKLEFIDEKSLYDMHGTRTLKAGHVASFAALPSGEIVHVVVAHWPGRMYHGEAAPMRTNLGLSLHRSMQRYRDEGQLNLVVMGDFNDDPSSPSLAQYFCATRDRTLAVDKDHFFYNPFWRRMGESEPLGMVDSICGSHYYAGGTDSRWFTYDQILFSPSFLGAGSFLLDESTSRILQLPGLLERIINDESIYDHFPVSSTVYIKDYS
ncbi:MULTISPECIES: endonuclease/exonuclease/phosphatase family protein [unclassified Luteibacter]|uniref:endonuclease/exonuclease/phosphatase family protein n=1 Tax=Luteibacter sp. PvP019 TaxID=3156436 RepID=UPI00339385C6